MQVTIYYSADDEWILKVLEVNAYAERRSISKALLLALEDYFGKRGELKPQEVATPEGAAKGGE